MNKEMMHRTTHSTTTQSKTTHSELRIEKFIVFTVANYHLALPVGAVLQVVTRPPTAHELDKAGLIQIGRHMIQQLDLDRQLSADPAQKSSDRLFFVITPNWKGGLWAIPVSEPPNLVEFPLELLRPLPPFIDRFNEQFNEQFNDRFHDGSDTHSVRQDTHQSAVLRIASHAATLTQDAKTTTVFLLNLKRLLIQPEALPPANESSSHRF